jgi:Cu-Zn family superoxide dismutase
MKTSVLSFCTVLSALGFVAVARAADDHKHKAEPITEAVAVVMPTKASKSNVAGTIVLKQQKGYVQVTGEVTGLSPGEHGFHIHMFGDLRAPDGASAGGHYNPHGHPHGGPESKERHEGDLGNIKADAKGVAKVNVRAKGLDLHHVLGRSIVVHGDADDLESQPAGNAGPRIGIGVIGLAETKAATAAK